MFGLLNFIYNRKIKKGSINNSVLLKIPPIAGVFNFVIAGAFLLLFILKPTAFSSEQTIQSPLMNVFFTIFSTYFYILALPLSLGYVGISILLKQKQYLVKGNYWVSVFSNGIGAIMIAVLTYQVFG